MRRFGLLCSLLFSPLFVMACQPIDPLIEGACGNAVIEGDEDCDIHVRDGYQCKQPGEDWQCSLVCNEGRCPAGYGCGADDVCRRAIGLFEGAPFAEVSSQARELLTGDFDADRRIDVVGLEPGRARVHFLGASGETQQVSFYAPFRPSVGKMGTLGGEPDATDDLCQSLDVGLGASLADASGSFTAKTYASIVIDSPTGVPYDVKTVLPLAFDALPGDEHTGDETGALVAVSPKDSDEILPFGAFLNFGSGEIGVVLLVKGGRPDNLVAQPVSGDFDQYDGCEEIVFPTTSATGTSSVVPVYKPCVPPGMGQKGYSWRAATKPTDGLLAEVEMLGTLVGAVFKADIDYDQRLDLLLTSQVALSPGSPDPVIALEVAYGVGDGTFHSTSPAPFPGDAPGADNRSSIYAVLPDGQKPLAMADFDFNGLPDFVTASRVLRGLNSVLMPGDEPTILFAPTYQSKRAWTEATFADMNGDGFLDVVASSAGAPNIDVLTTNGFESFNPLQISTTGAVANLVAGDFDGDLIQDLGFQDATAPGESFLEIAYGRPSGGPEAPVKVGRFTGIERIVRGNVHIFGVDNITDLGVLSENVNLQKTVSFFPGNGNRVVQASFLLTEPDTGRLNVPLLTSVGVLIEEGGVPEQHNDVAILSTRLLEGENPDEELAFQEATNALRIWGLQGTGEADFDIARSATCKMPPGSIVFPGLEQASSITVARSPDGRRGRVFVATPKLSVVPGPMGVDLGSILVEVQFDEGSCQVLDDANPAFAGTGNLLTRIKVVDLDGNGEPDVLALLKSYTLEDLGAQIGTFGEGGPPAKPLSSDLVIFWDGAIGGGGVIAATKLPGQPFLVNDYAVGDLDGDTIPELVSVGDEGSLVHSLTPGSRTLVAVGSLPGIDSGAEAVALADADGDGVNDVVLAGGGLRYFRGLAKGEVLADVATGNR